MAFTFGFYNSMEHDRQYNAEQMSAIFDGIIVDGILETVGEIFATIPGDGMQVIVKTGRAWFNHTWSLNDSHMPLSIDSADVTLTRYDAVVLEVNASQEVRENSIKIVKGIPSANPVWPTLINTDDIHQHPLAYVRVRPGVTIIAASDVDVRVGQGDCPFATAPLETVPIDDLFNQWEGEFDEWFEGVKLALTEDVVSNLQYQIDLLKNAGAIKISDNAAAKLNLPKNSSVDDALAKIGDKGLAKIGDIKFTADPRNETNWALCNGAAINSSLYPDAAGIIDPMMVNWCASPITGATSKPTEISSTYVSGIPSSISTSGLYATGNAATDGSRIVWPIYPGNSSMIQHIAFVYSANYGKTWYFVDNNLSGTGLAHQNYLYIGDHGFFYSKTINKWVLKLYRGSSGGDDGARFLASSSLSGPWSLMYEVTSAGSAAYILDTGSELVITAPTGINVSKYSYDGYTWSDINRPSELSGTNYFKFLSVVKQGTYYYSIVSSGTNLKMYLCRGTSIQNLMGELKTLYTYELAYNNMTNMKGYTLSQPIVPVVDNRYAFMFGAGLIDLLNFMEINSYAGLSKTNDIGGGNYTYYYNVMFVKISNVYILWVNNKVRTSKDITTLYTNTVNAPNSAQPSLVVNGNTKTRAAGGNNMYLVAGYLPIVNLANTYAYVCVKEE